MSRASRAGGAFDVERALWDGYVAAYPARLQVEIGDVVSARLRAGLSTSRLSLELLNAQRVTLLWMRNKTALAELQAALHDRLD